MHSLNQNNKTMVEQYVAEVAENNNKAYMLTIARDGESPVRSIYFYDNAIDAVGGYDNYQDWGFAKEYLTVTLYEPTGRTHSKVLKRPKGGECVFVQKDYIDAERILLSIKDEMKYGSYLSLVSDFAMLFSKDNQRFDPVRFFKQAGCIIEDKDLGV